MALIGNIAIVLLVVAAVVRADIYMHNMRGSNNRLNEQNQDRTSNNRLFDSQNNDRGGYNVGDAATTASTATTPSQAPMKYYEGSILRLEWTSQHGSMNDNLNDNLVIQYMCENMNSPGYGAAPSYNAPLTGLRDGHTTTQSTTGNAGDVNVGRHELAAYFTDCQTRERNRGLFIADQTLNGNTAEYTRQNENGDDSGLECPEERDYYPYWHPSPWRDIAILTSNTSMCAYYQAESENVVGRNLCIGQPTKNNRAACDAAAGTWTQMAAHELPPPECKASEYGRDNHLGNTIGGQTLSYNWTIPTGALAGAGSKCVLRLRYNISTGDYDGWNTFSDKNGATASPVKDNTDFNFGDSSKIISVRLAMNTDQYGRTFQDRSHIFEILPLTPQATPPNGGKIYNLNVRGRRGNIVETYPAVEYDFVPNDLTVTANDLVHIQWTGSLTTPDGAGNGQAATDRNNMVCIPSLSQSIPLSFDDPACNMFTDLATKEKVSTSSILPADDPTTVDDELDNRAPYFNLDPVQIGGGVPGKHYYMCTRNNSFSNRDQKGVITVV